MSEPDQLRHLAYLIEQYVDTFRKPPPSPPYASPTVLILAYEHALAMGEPLPDE